MSQSPAKRRVPLIPNSPKVVSAKPLSPSPDNLRERVQELENRLRAQQRTLDQLHGIVGEFYSEFPQHTQRVPTVKPGEDPLIATVRCLVKSLNHANQALEDAARQARQEVRSKDSFLANMSHEIRTPMNGIIGMVQLVEKTELSAEQREYVETISYSTETLMRFLNDILDYSKLHARKLALEPRPFSPSRLLDAVTGSFRGSAEQKNLQMACHLDAGVPDALMGDDTRLRQVLSNLVGNAIKFTTAGKIDLYLTAMERKAELWKLQFDVSDTGIGIDPRIQSELFEPFVQAEASTGRVFGGTGLGLAICRDIVELMQGRIWVESQPGRGSVFRFTVYLPESDELNLTVGKRTGGETGQVSPDRNPVSRTVLLVEDNFVNQKVARLTLEKLGYDVEVANCGLEAVQKAAARRYDVICMDVTMPDIDGLEATRRIRQLEGGSADSRIMAVTGHAFQDDRERCLKAGMDDFVAKPFDLFQLGEALERLVTGSNDEVDAEAGLSS